MQATLSREQLDLSLIEHTAATTYETYAAASGKPTDYFYTRPYCAEMSALMLHNLAKVFIDASLKLYIGRLDCHYFLQAQDEQKTLIDLTWQQFLPESKRGKPESPRTLLVPQAEATRFIGRLGMSRSRLKIWNEAEDSQHDWRAFQDPYLSQLITV